MILDFIKGFIVTLIWLAALCGVFVTIVKFSIFLSKFINIDVGYIIAILIIGMVGGLFATIPRLASRE